MNILLLIRRLFEFFEIVKEKIFWSGEISIPKSAKINQKLIINGIGKVKIGDNCVFGFSLGPQFRESSIVIQSRYKDAIIEIDDNCTFNNNIYICSIKKIKIGKNCLFGEGIRILDFDGHSSSLNINERRFSKGKIDEVIIGDNVWIGNNVQVLRGTRIGDNCIVAAGSVLNKNYKANKFIGGVPAITFGDINNYE